MCCPFASSLCSVSYLKFDAESGVCLILVCLFAGVVASRMGWRIICICSLSTAFSQNRSPGGSLFQSYLFLVFLLPCVKLCYMQIVFPSLLSFLSITYIMLHGLMFESDYVYYSFFFIHFNLCIICMGVSWEFSFSC